MKNNCVICHKHSNESLPTLYHGKTCIVYHYFPVNEKETMYQGHLFVETKRHVPSFAELTSDEARELGELTRVCAKVLKQALDAEHVYTFTISDQVQHLHMHVLAR